MPPSSPWLNKIFPDLSINEVATLTGIAGQYLGVCATHPDRLNVAALRTLSETAGVPPSTLLTALGYTKVAEAVVNGSYAETAPTVAQYAKLLKTFREAAGVSEVQASRQLGAAGYVNKLERGENGVSIPMAEVLSRTYDVALSSLILGAPRIVAGGEAAPRRVAARSEVKAEPQQTPPKRPAKRTYKQEEQQREARHAKVRETTAKLLQSLLTKQPGQAEYKLALALIHTQAFGFPPKGRHAPARVSFALAGWKGPEGLHLVRTERHYTDRDKSGRSAVFAFKGRMVKNGRGRTRHLPAPKVAEARGQQVLPLPTVQPAARVASVSQPLAAGMPQLVTGEGLGAMLATRGAVKVERVVIGGREFFAVEGG